MEEFVSIPPSELSQLFKSIDIRARKIIPWSQILNYFLYQIQTDKEVKKIVYIFINILFISY
jgi:hypothetical protein